MRGMISDCARTIVMLVLPLSGIGLAQAPVQPAPSLVVDARSPVSAPAPTDYQENSYTSPDGETITLNSRYLSRNGKPWLPVMGEFHYTRVPQSQWEQEIMKMKASGVQIVSTYVFWIHHEEIEGQFDWSGRRNLRRFVELCAKHGMYVDLRIGPWDHGEVRNGGFPDWLLKKVPKQDLRRNVPSFMNYVRVWYTQVGDQVKGLMWDEGGPIIGIQLENEYSIRGPHAGTEYILALKQLAIASGFHVPLYTETGWGNAAVPKGAVLPVYGGYPDAPWDGTLKQLPPQEIYTFRFGSRVSGNMGTIAGTGLRTASPPTGGTPFMTAEIGGGIQDTYHRRPVIEPDDVAAMFPVMLGSGVNLYGTYMFQAGENPQEKLTTLQESQATGYPSDLPVKSYDFQAPLGEFGQERESFRKLKLFQYFLNDFGSQLAPLAVRMPEVRPMGPSDLSVPRISVRTNGKEGFLFWNNYVRDNAMPAWKEAQVTIQLPHGTIEIPQQPVTIPSGAYFIWPFHLNLAGLMLRYSTAQLFTRIDNGTTPTFVFFAIPGIPAEFAFDHAPGVTLAVGRGTVRHEGTVVFARNLKTGFQGGITFRAANGGTIRILLLTEQEAEHTWKARVADADRLVYTPQQFYADESHCYFQSLNSTHFSFSLFPDIEQPLQASSPLTHLPAKGTKQTFEATVAPVALHLQIVKMQRAGLVPPVELGPSASWRKRGVAKAPTDALFQKAAEWRIATTLAFPDDVSNLFLRVGYIGDVAHLLAGSTLLDDNFYNGRPWQVGLRRFAPQDASGTFDLQILPLRKDAPIFLEPRYRPTFPVSGQIAVLNSLRLVPQYRLVVDAGNRASSKGPK